MASLILDIIVTIILIVWVPMAMTSPMMLGAPGAGDDRPKLVLIAAIFFLPTVIFLLYVFADKSFYGIPAPYCLAVSLALAALLSFLLRLPKLIANAFAGIPNSGYFKNATHVYLNGNKISRASPDSFENLDTVSAYARDEHHVFYHGLVIPDADPHSFEPAADNQAPNGSDPGVLFWKDIHAVYANGKILPGAIPSRFTYLAGWYAKSDKAAYYGGTVIEGADAATFTILDNHFAKDQTRVFYLGHKVALDEPGPALIDPATLKVMHSESHAYIYCKDKAGVYARSGKEKHLFVRIPSADPDTFIALEDGYSKDKSRVYTYDFSIHKVVLVMGADPQTFSPPR